MSDRKKFLMQKTFSLRRRHISLTKVKQMFVLVLLTTCYLFGAKHFPNSYMKYIQGIAFVNDNEKRDLCSKDFFLKQNNHRNMLRMLNRTVKT